MDNKKIIIDNHCLGTRMLLVAVRPAYTYTNGKRGDNITGYAYDVCLPAHNLDKLSIKIEGTQQIAAPAEGYVPVELTNLVVRPYVGRDGRLAFTAAATAIKAITTKS